MIKKLTKHGNSYALVIDRAILDLLNIDVDTPLEVATDGENLIVSRADSARRKEFKKILEEGNGKYGRMLKRLAD